MNTQLPPHYYTDANIFEQERTHLFQYIYVGSVHLVPNPGDYFVLRSENNSKVLLRDQSGQLHLMSNLCKHRQAAMLEGSGNLLSGGQSGHIVCPLHRWTYNGANKDPQPAGTLIGAPGFDNHCTQLNNYPLIEKNGLLFYKNPQTPQAPYDWLDIQQFPQFDFTGYSLVHRAEHLCNYNWKTFMEVYLDDYHVQPFHPGLGSLVDCKSLTWSYGQDYSVQTVSIKPLSESPKTGCPHWDTYLKALHDYKGPDGYAQGAVWLSQYPLVMMEWYPEVITISTLHPLSATQTLNTVEYYYPEEVSAFEPHLCQAHQSAYQATMLEDDVIAEKMEQGRRALALEQRSEFGPYHPTLEEGMVHFHRWYFSKMPHLSGNSWYQGSR